MIDKNVRNCNVVKRLVNVIITLIAFMIAQIVSDTFLKGSFMWTLVILVIVLLILTPLGTYLDNKIDKHYENKRNL